MTRPFLVPETLQTSGMDCGPAALRSVFEGLGVGVNYERLREACRTSADGTSIDAMEDLCNDLGLEAFQEIAPIPDAIRILAARAPAIVVVKSAGAPHFIVLWRKVGGLVQIMDPERGRRWVTPQELERSFLSHPQPFDDEMWKAWFPSTEWHTMLEARLRRLGIARPLQTLGVREATAIDAAARLLLRLLARDAIPQQAASEVLDALVATELAAPRGALPASLAASDWDPEGRLVVRGVVFLAIRPGRRTPPVGDDLAPLFARNPPRAFRLLARKLTPAGRRLAVFLAIAATLLAILAFAEMLFLRAAFNADALLALPQQRLAGVVLYGVLVVTLLFLEALLGTWILRLGRFLELRTRIALLLKLPRLPDRYFRTRPMSDVAHRAQGLADLKPLPEIFVTLAKQSLDVVITTAALAILHPRGIPYCVLALAFGLGVPWLGTSARQQLESRQRGHASALGSLYIDALFGVVPIRTHGGQPGIRALQEQHLVNWRTDAERTVKLISLTEVIQSIGVLVAIVLLLLDYLRRDESQTALLLLVFWALRLPLQTRAVETTSLRLSPAAASAGRLVEPLTASETMPDVDREPLDASLVSPEIKGITLEVRNVGVVLGTHAVLSDVSVTINAGEQVAIVGSSGAGKSTLLAIMLGLVEAREGEILVDGEPLGLYGIDRLRREVVWIDPTVQLWNRSLLHNLQFGNPAETRQPLEGVLERAALGGVVDRMPRGLATDLGEGGARVSGGEGQRVRIGRGLLRSGARLVLLDEAFRGLDRTTRRAISRNIREAAGRATVLEVTHDVADTGDFDRVVVIEDGKLVEAGEPAALLATPGSRYAELVRADLGVQRGVWGNTAWRRLTVEGGAIRAASDPVGTRAEPADG